MRGIKLTADNHERAASAALDYLVSREEIDESQIVVYANSFASIWGMRLAASDHRIAAIAAPKLSLSDKRIIGDREVPRWKQLFGFVTQAATEEELDEVLAAMVMNEGMSRIKCPVLMTAGEYDLRSPLGDVYALFDQLEAPAELWVMADQHHNLKLGGTSEWAVDGVIVDWLADRLAGKPQRNAGRVLYVDGNIGPYSARTPAKRAWYEEPEQS